MEISLAFLQWWVALSLCINVLVYLVNFTYIHNMKHPASNLCVDFIIEHSKAKTSEEGLKICKKYEDVLFTHFENPDRVKEKETRSDINLIVSMYLFGHCPEFTGDYLLSICDTYGNQLRNECYVALAILENLWGCV